jgi:hypothetical protein
MPVDIRLSLPSNNLLLRCTPVQLILKKRKMNMANTFSPESAKFIVAFMAAWNDVLMERGNDPKGAEIMKYYSSPTHWTAVMLERACEQDSRKSDGIAREGVLGRAIDKYEGHGVLEKKYEWSKYDLLGVRQISTLPDGLSDKAKQESWLKFAEIAIEHENGDDVETEVWKLCQFRAKLKVLVFYDFSQKILDSNDRESNCSDKSFAEKVAEKEWLAKKTDLLGKIIAGANDVLPKEEASFLLIVGSRADDTVLWRASQFQGRAFSDWSPMPINKPVSEIVV